MNTAGSHINLLILQRNFQKPNKCANLSGKMQEIRKLACSREYTPEQREHAGTQGEHRNIVPNCFQLCACVQWGDFNACFRNKT